MANNNVTYIPNRLKNAAKGGFVTGTIDVLDDAKGKDQQTVNHDVDNSLSAHNEHLETHDREIADRYTKEQVNNIVSRTPETDVVIVRPPEEVEVNLEPTSTETGFFNTDGSINENQSYTIKKYAVTPGNKYFFYDRYSSTVNIYCVGWFDSNGDIVGYEPYHGSNEGYTFDDIEVTAPVGASFLYLNTQNSQNFGYVAIKVAAPQYISDIPAYLDIVIPNVIDPETGRSSRANKLYRVPGPTNTTYSEWAWDSTNWVMMANKDYGIDDTPTVNSPNFITSGAVFNSIRNIIGDLFSIETTAIRTDGYAKSAVVGINCTDFLPITGLDDIICVELWRYSTIVPLAFYDKDKNFISAITEVDNYTVNLNIPVTSIPTGAKYIRCTANVSGGNNSAILSGLNIAALFECDNEIKKNIQNLFNNISEEIRLSPVSVNRGKWYGSDGEHDNGNLVYSKFNIISSNIYKFSSYFVANTNIDFIVWLDENNNYIPYYSPTGSSTESVTLNKEAIIAPPNAVYACVNCSKAYINQLSVFKVGQIISSNTIKNNLGSIIANSAKLTVLNPTYTVSNSYFAEGNIIEHQSYSIRKYAVEAGKIYTFSGNFGSSTSIPFIGWADSNGNLIYEESYRGPNASYVDEPVVAPEGAAFAWLNSNNSKYPKESNFKTVEVIIKSRNLQEQNIQIVSDISSIVSIDAIDTNDGHFFNSNGTIGDSSVFSIYKFNVEEGKHYFFSGKHSSSVNIPFVAWADENDNFIYAEPYGGASVTYVDKELIAPIGAHYLLINWQYGYSEGVYDVKTTDAVIKSRELQKTLDDTLKAVIITQQAQSDILVGFPDKNDGHIIENDTMRSYVFDNIDPTNNYVAKDFGVPSSGYNLIALVCYYNGETYIGYDPQVFVSVGPFYQSEYIKLNVPNTCNKIIICTQRDYSNKPVLSIKTAGDYIKSQDLQDQIDAISGGGGGGGDVYNITNNYEFNNTQQTVNLTATPSITADTNNYLAPTGDDTDRTADILAMLSSTGICRLGAGTYWVDSLIMPNGSAIIGSGAETRIYLKPGDNKFAIKMNSYCTVNNLRLYGNTSIIAPTEEGTRHGILWQGNYTEDRNSDHQPQMGTISDVYIFWFNGGAITCNDTGYGTHNYLSVTNVHIFRCYVGIYVKYWSEFHKFTNVRCAYCYYGCINNGGNNVFTNCDFSSSQECGFLMDNSMGQSPNNSHGSCIGCVFNHTAHNGVSNSGIGIKILNCSNGFIFDGCQIFYSQIYIKDSEGIVVSSTNFGEGNIVFTIIGGGVVLFANNIHQGTPTISISGNNKVHFSNCYNKSNGTVIEN